MSSRKPRSLLFLVHPEVRTQTYGKAPLKVTAVLACGNNLPQNLRAAQTVLVLDLLV